VLVKSKNSDRNSRTARSVILMFLKAEKSVFTDPEMRASSVSLMPEDLEKSLSKQDLADVIAYLRGGT
jgi:hypothetical protein